MPRQRILRAVTALLLGLIAIDLAAGHTCALEVDNGPGRARTSVAAVDGSGTAANSHAVLHPDHCFCHGLSVGADPSALHEPFHTDGTVPDTPPGHLLRVSSALFHPPQLPA